MKIDIAIIGAGIAGVSLAAALAARGAGDTIIAETEAQPAYHATGRSAANWHETYGGPGVQPLSAASAPLLRAIGVMGQRGALTIARACDEAAVAAFVARFADLGVNIDLLDRAGVAAHVPGLRADWTAGAWEPECSDIDVAGLHQHYLGVARRGGAQLWGNARLTRAERHGDGWRLQFADGREIHARVVVDAAGAWADEVAAICGAQPLGIAAYRRTIVQLRTAPVAPPTLPLVLDIGGGFYFKPEAGRLWLSPHDETPSPPCDAAPEELDVAIAIDQFEQVVDWRVAAVEHRWAGLRSFAPDRLPVYGWDAGVPGLFWAAGQGGFGIQTAPAAAELAARLILGEPAGEVDPAPYAAGRFVSVAFNEPRSGK